MDKVILNRDNMVRDQNNSLLQFTYKYSRNFSFFANHQNEFENFGVKIKFLLF